MILWFIIYNRFSTPCPHNRFLCQRTKPDQTNSEKYNNRWFEQSNSQDGSPVPEMGEAWIKAGRLLYRL